MFTCLNKRGHLLINFKGTLLTFVQFLFVAVTGYVAQFDRQSRFYLAPNQVPLRRWIINIVLFFSINVLNNHAFKYNISVPVHIILRSGGSITTMAAGYMYGKRYTRTQVIAVVLLTFGVIIAAWSDAQAKVRAGRRRHRRIMLTQPPRVSERLAAGLLSAPASCSSLWLRYSRPSWVYIQRQRMRHTARTGKKTSSTRMPSHCRFSCHSCHPCPVIWPIS